MHLPNIINRCLIRLKGDTLFAGGCGRFFEGTADQMYKALVEILGSLPEETVSYSSQKFFFF